jgi:hypothetical protein
MPRPTALRMRDLCPAMRIRFAAVFNFPHGVCPSPDSRMRSRAALLYEGRDQHVGPPLKAGHWEQPYAGKTSSAGECPVGSVQ